MALDVSPINPGLATERRVPISVELSDRRLPVRMRLDAVRSLARIPRPQARFLRRVMMIPGAVVLRLWSR